MTMVLDEASFGAALKRWRNLRRFSQLELALRAEVSARHVCFLETGKASPSRAMVLTLADALEMPRDARNALLEAAGFAQIYRARAPDDPSLQVPRHAIDWMLERHAPYPGFAFDRHWRLMRANPPAERLLALAGLEVGDSLLDAMAPDKPLRGLIENWREVCGYMLARLRTEIGYLGGDPVLEAAAARFAAERRPDDGPSPAQAVLPVRYRLGAQRLSFITTLAHFGAAEDVALTDLRIELMFPADEATRAALTE